MGEWAPKTAGVPQVVATMGTALNARHVQQLRRFVSRVVLVFDADEGGITGVDRALEVFVSHDVELRVATLPAGLDPCDLLVTQGAAIPLSQAITVAALRTRVAGWRIAPTGQTPLSVWQTAYLKR